MICLRVGDLVYDPSRTAMATVTEIVSSGPAAQVVQLEPADGGPPWTAPTYGLQLHQAVFADAG